MSGPSKLCVDCAHYYFFGAKEVGGTETCQRPIQDFVNGSAYETLGEACKTERNLGACGPGGQFFAAKNETAGKEAQL